MVTDAPRHAQTERLKFLDGLLFWEARANRRDLQDHFQVSPAQAALDLKAYLSMTKRGHVEYDTRAKRYVATAVFEPVFGVPGHDRWLARFRAAEPSSVDIVPALVRKTDVRQMARVARAIRDNESLLIRYQSMQRPGADRRWIAPSAVASDGVRWHVRAYCFLRKSYRDFVLVRVQKVLEARTSTDVPPDIAWECMVELDLGPAPHLGESQAVAVRREYGFTGKRMTVRVREALEFYAMRRWGLDRPDSRLRVVGRRLLEKTMSVDQDVGGPHFGDGMNTEYNRVGRTARGNR